MVVTAVTAAMPLAANRTRTMDPLTPVVAAAEAQAAKAVAPVQERGPPAMATPADRVAQAVTAAPRTSAVALACRPQPAGAVVAAERVPTPTPEPVARAAEVAVAAPAVWLQKARV
jgi:hypothetical protein